MGFKGYPALALFGLALITSSTLAFPPLQPQEDLRPVNAISSLEESFQIPTPRHRLPRQVIPSHYVLRQRPILLPGDPDRFKAPSDVKITIRCDEVTREIVLHRFKDTIEIKLDEVTVTKLSDGAAQAISGQTFDDEKDFYKIALTNPLEVGQTYDLFIPFIATVKVSEVLAELVGLYGSWYIDSAEPDVRRYLSTTKLEPFHSRKVLPCFDEPDLKATFKVILGRHENYHSLSNMENKVTTPIEGLENWVWDEYESTPVPMSTYLLCMIVSDFTSVTAQNGEFDKPIRTWAAKHVIDTNGGDYAARSADKILRYLEDKMQIKYALPKMDSISIPQFPSGAMENWGLNTYRDSLLIYFPNINTEANRDLIDSVLTHELAHQWFGNWVTCKWWSDIWLNEGFATYLEAYGVELMGPEFKAKERFAAGVVQLGMRFDQGPLTHPVRNTALLPAEIVSVFSRISYQKAGALIRMMEGFLTEELLWNGLLAYLNKYELQGAEQDNLFESLTEAGKSVLPPGVTVKDIMDPWTLKSGYPIVRVTAAGSRRIYISQEKFRLNQSDPQPLELWNIPLVVVTADNPDFSKRTPDLWMKSNELLVNFPVPDTTKFVMVNPDAYGYFRVHYEPKLLTLIKGQLNSDHNVISPQTRSQLLDDYLTFALLSDYASVVSALELTHYLGKETELVVWSTVLTNLREPMNKLSGTPGFIALEHYLKPRVESALKTVETATTGASAILRASLMEWACSLGSADCITKSEDMLDAWRNDPDNLNILADIQQVVFCTGVSKKGQSELNFLISQYKRVETHEIIRLRLLNALGCVEDSTLLTVLLAAAIDPDEIREVDSTLLLQRIVSNVKGRDLGYDFITNNFAEVGAARFAAVVSTLSLHWHTDENLTKLEDFIASHQDELASVLPSLNASLANIRNNMAWVENKGKPMAEWMIAQ